MAFTICMIPVVIGVVPLLLFVPPIDALLFPFMILLALAMIVGLHTASPAFPISVARRRHSFKRPITISLGVKGVAVCEDERKKVVAWSAVRKLVVEKRYICIDMPDDLILIPHAVFLDSDHACEFLAAAKAYKRGETPPLNNIVSAWPPAPETLHDKL